MSAAEGHKVVRMDLVEGMDTTVGMGMVVGMDMGMMVRQGSYWWS